MKDKLCTGWYKWIVGRDTAFIVHVQVRLVVDQWGYLVLVHKDCSVRDTTQVAIKAARSIYTMFVSTSAVEASEIFAREGREMTDGDICEILFEDWQEWEKKHG